MDALSDVLKALRISGGLFLDAEFTAPWCVASRVGPEDFRNIAKRKQYVEAYDDMLERTDTNYAPWHVVATDHKKWARLTALRILVDELGRGVNLAEHELTPEIFELARKLWGWTPDKKSG